MNRHEDIHDVSMLSGCETVRNPMAFVHPLWPVLYVDNHLLAVYKPAGLLVQGDPSGDPCLLDLAKRWIKDRYQKPGNVFVGMVHRLDRPVSGLVLLARTSKAASRVSAAFRENRVRKIYLAVVEGRPKNTTGTLIHGVMRRETGPVAVYPVDTPGTQRAELHYRTLACAKDSSLLAVHLKTGRKHQIRAQLAHMGCPILGDVRYGASEALEQRAIALHAWKLVLPHPTKGETVDLSCPVPMNWPWSAAMDDLSLSSPFRPLWHWRQYQPELT